MEMKQFASRYKNSVQISQFGNNYLVSQRFSSRPNKYNQSTQAPRLHTTQAISSQSVQTNWTTTDQDTSQATSSANFELSCPISPTTSIVVHEQPQKSTTYTCPTTNRRYVCTDDYIDFTLTSGVVQKYYKDPSLTRQDLFRAPVVSRLYEAGWRQSFSLAGFPGVDAEFARVCSWMSDIARGDVTVMDLSCGSGLFTRLFATKQHMFKQVIAVDYSPSMLKQTKKLLTDNKVDTSNVLLVRADVQRLPFESGSIPLIHAGAAIHCWPNPRLAMAEIARVLAPGGMFVASTFLDVSGPIGELVGDDAAKAISRLLPKQSQDYIRTWSIAELEELMISVGLTDFSFEQKRRYIMFRVRKSGVFDSVRDKSEKSEGVTSVGSGGFVLANPIDRKTVFKFEQQPAGSQTFTCPSTGRSFSSTMQYIDMTLSSGLEQVYYKDARVFRQDLFGTSWVSSVYENGWRQGFGGSGFPGVDAEFARVCSWMSDIARGDVTVMDLSCGSGLFTRLFATKQHMFKQVIAVDYSDTMLKQTDKLLKQNNVDQSNVLLVRADVQRLPFESGSIPLIHAGAAIHCWPNPRLAMAEIARVLAPGGVFVASTFMDQSTPVAQILGNRLASRLSLTGTDNTYKWWNEDELRELMSSVGLVGFKRDRSQRYIMWKVSKPKV